jgi:hypothetical protein
MVANITRRMPTDEPRCLGGALFSCGSCQATLGVEASVNSLNDAQQQVVQLDHLRGFHRVVELDGSVAGGVLVGADGAR